MGYLEQGHIRRWRRIDLRPANSSDKVLEIFDDTKTTRGNILGSGAIDFSASTGVFKTPTGAATLGGNVTVSTGKTLNVTDNGSFQLAGTAIGATAAEVNTAADLSANGGLVRVKKIALVAKSAEFDTAWDLPAKSVLLDVYLDVTTAESTGTTKTLDVGLLSSESGGDVDGFLDGVSTAATGLKKGVATVTTGTNEQYFSSTTRGVLLETFLAGADTVGDVGTLRDTPHLSDAVTAKSISYTPGSAQTEFVGNLYIVYMEIA